MLLLYALKVKLPPEGTDFNTSNVTVILIVDCVSVKLLFHFNTSNVTVILCGEGRADVK